MMVHIVLLQPRAALSDDERGAVLEAVQAVATRCPSVRACRIGRRRLHGLPGYEQGMQSDYQYALVLEFDDMPGLREYLTHTEHEQLGRFFTSSASAALAYDYEMVDVRDAHSLL